MELKQYQQRAVNELVEKIKRYLGMPNAPKIYLEAPTGAGKTVMASKALEDLSNTIPYDYNCVTDKVAFIWIAPNKLHEMSYLSMKSFFKYTNSMRPIVWDELDHSLGYLEHGDILFLNWPSITRDDAIILRDTEQRTGLVEVARKTRIDQHTPLIVIIDEEQLYSGAAAKKAREILAKLNPDLEIRISATPNYPKGGNYDRIYINRNEVVKEEMIKKDVVINPGVSTQKAQDEALGVDAYFLKLALAKRKELKDRYDRIGGIVNPLLLIQLPNDNKTLNADDHKIIDTVKTYLKLPGLEITEDNGKLGIWLSEDKKNLDKISEPNDLTEVLIFKEAISKGWDCPRAAVLLIYRDIKSYSFTVQTVGRILRMPNQKYYSDDALNHGYVFTNLENEYIDIKADEMDYMSQNTATIRNNITPISLPATSVGTHKVQNTLGYKFRRILRNTFMEMWHLNEPYFNFSYDDEENEADSSSSLDNNIIENRRMMAQQGIDLDVHKIYMVVPKDMTVDIDKVGIYKVPDNGKAQLARTQGEVDRMFRNFCMANLIRFDKRDSTAAMVQALLEFMNRYAQYMEIEAKKIILFNKNRDKFARVMKVAQERYLRDLEERMEQAKLVESKYDWTLPSVRGYKGDTHKAVEATGHALQPYYELNEPSIPEQHFRAFLEQNRESIEWWYKNGDSGKEHFSVVYSVGDGENVRKGNFYVDYIIKLRNGRLCLFDTKDASGGIGDNVEKHNALIDYINDYNANNNSNMVGGIIVEERGQWLYSPLPINDAGDHGGWRVFEPEELNK